MKSVEQFEIYVELKDKIKISLFTRYCFFVTTSSLYSFVKF
jgi:hypothetical protein